MAMTKDTGHVCCNPQLQPNDASRQRKTIDFLRQYNLEHEEGIEYTEEAFSEVNSRFDIVTAIHSVYNQSFSQFFANCVKVGAHTVYVALHLTYCY